MVFLKDTLASLQEQIDNLKKQTYQLVNEHDNTGATSWIYTDYDPSKWTLFEIALDNNNVTMLEVAPNGYKEANYTKVALDFSANAANNVRFSPNTKILGVWGWAQNTSTAPALKMWTIRVFTHS